MWVIEWQDMINISETEIKELCKNFVLFVFENWILFHMSTKIFKLGERLLPLEFRGA